MDSFYMFLPSNVEDPTGKNTIGNYVTYLPQVLKLFGKWEVGLSEILITKTWFNIVEDGEVRMMVKQGLSTHVCPFPAGCYRDYTHIMKIVNDCLEKLVKKYTPNVYSPTSIEYTADQQRIVIYPGIMDGKMVVPYLSRSLNEILGFDFYTEHDFERDAKVENNLIKGARVSERSLNIDATITAIYVYCDIIKSTVVGDSLAKLLRVVSVPSIKFGEKIQKTYDQPLYFPLEKKEFQSIEIDIKDDAGETLKFDSGRVIVVLHFRKRDD